LLIARVALHNQMANIPRVLSLLAAGDVTIPLRFGAAARCMLHCTKYMLRTHMVHYSDTMTMLCCPIVWAVQLMETNNFTCFLLFGNRVALNIVQCNALHVYWSASVLCLEVSVARAHVGD
jgi:hypothetical protein